MRVLFDYHELLSVVENGVVEIAGNANDAQKHAYCESKKKDKKALYFIYQGVNDEVFEKIEDAATSKQAWDTLMTTYKGAKKVKKVKLQTLRRQYELLQMESSETVATYINRVLALTNKSKVYGEEYNEQAKVEKILRTLTPNFEHIVATIEEAHDLSQMTVDELLVKSMAVLVKKDEDVVSTSAKVMVIITTIMEYKDNTQKAHCVQGDDDADSSHALLMVTVVGETPNFHTWFLDTGCTNHMSGKRELFVDLDQSFHTKVKFVDDRTIPVTGKGRILINLKNGDHKYISNVFYVPSMKSNLLSVGQLLEKVYVMSLRDNQFSILDKQGTLILKFGHLNFQSLKLLAQGQMVKGMPSIHNLDQLCEACTLGKHHKMPFVAEQQQRATQPLELVHFDVCGPMNTMSNGNNRSPTRSVQNITPVEAWSGFMPSVKHLKVFGSVAYAHVPLKIPPQMKKPLQAMLKKPPQRKPRQNLQGHSDNADHQYACKITRWVNAMNEEIKAIERNNTWVLTDIPQAHKAIDVKWVFKTKVKSNGETIRLIVGLVAQNQWKIHQMDVKSAFLNGPLEEEVYVKQPPGFMKQGSEDKVYRLKKALYGLKQAPRAWNKCVDSFFLQAGFEKCPSEHALYVKINNFGDILLLCLYVDDLIFISNNPTMIEDFKKSMMGELEMTDLGLVSYFLGIEVLGKFAAISYPSSQENHEVLERYS
ncbi:hypothetical protein SLEP1_g34508 [Rubroshorea leprosula]|uniref:Reverse transcriptase Ty1/copia-type domain-containing protein n=1 Tax=Rubroshorea leprosula TaxID=152421 RepID=A0AAV5KK51_9ROSI|nr:hypothetical protein SLEP1_g34508 [Rubroshorea leprosula]